MITPELTAPAYTFYVPDTDDPREPVRAWQAHLAANRIGHTPPVDPATIANTTHTTAPFRPFRHTEGAAQ